MLRNLAFIIMFSAFLLSSCGVEAPEQVLSKYLNCLKVHDFEQAKTYSTSSTHLYLDVLKSQFELYEAGEQDANITISEIKLMREGKQWLIDVDMDVQLNMEKSNDSNQPSSPDEVNDPEQIIQKESV